MNRTLRLSLLLVLAFAITACSGKKEQVVIDDGSTTTLGNGTSGTGLGSDPWGLEQFGVSSEELERLGIVGNPLNYKTLYFQYNSSAIDRRSEIIAMAHAVELKKRGGASVVLEGHTDERGTRDYNLALGERRSMAVSSLMKATGVGNSNIEAVSFGEERAVDSAHNDAAWQKNRRVEISY